MDLNDKNRIILISFGMVGFVKQLFGITSFNFQRVLIGCLCLIVTCTIIYDIWVTSDVVHKSRRPRRRQVVFRSSGMRLHESAAATVLFEQNLSGEEEYMNMSQTEMDSLYRINLRQEFPQGPLNVR